MLDVSPLREFVRGTLRNIRIMWVFQEIPIRFRQKKRTAMWMNLANRVAQEQLSLDAT